MKWKSLVLLGLVVLLSSTVHAEPLDTSRLPSLLSSLQLDTPLDFCDERVPLESQEARERLEKELLLSLWDRPQAILWFKRSRRYLPPVEEILEKNGMPDDLKYLAIAESALRPHAGSRKGAIGFWQFMKYTGRKYGLVINGRIDERRNIFASTKAAIHYLSNLYEGFGSWTLAAAAYNMGEEGLMAEIMEQGSNNYYQLYLPLETQRYIFRVLSVKLIFSDPTRYGFRLSEMDYYPPLEFDQVQVQCSADTPIRIIAEAANTHFKTIKDLNPEIRGHYLAQGQHEILIPKGAAKGFLRRYQERLKHWSSNEQERIYRIKEGDNLSAIAERFGVPLAAIIIWNSLDPKKPIYPGDRLIIYRKQQRLDTDHNGE